MLEPGLFAASVVACIVTLAATPPLVRVLRHSNLLDVPNARSSHSRTTPRGGGIAVILGLVAGAIAGGPPSALWVLLGAVALAAAVGLVDDVRDLSALMRLVSQSVLAAAVALAVLHMAGSSAWPQAVFVATSVIWICGYVNAFNFMDGINGISGVSGAIAGVWFLMLGRTTSDPVLSVGGAVLIGACVGFLPWNFPRAKVFLGDVGSYGLGTLVGSLSIWALAMRNEPMAAVAPLLLYVVDTGSTLAIRMRRGESWKQAHRDHVYQRLGDVGLAQSTVTAVVAAATAAVCISVWIIPGWAALPPVAVALAIYVLLPRLVTRMGRHQRAVP